MSVYYLDSSAWVKRYFEEPGSGWVMLLFDERERLASSNLGYVEVASALARQQESRNLDQQKLEQLQEQLKADWTDLTGFPLTVELAERAVVLAQRYKLRGADAVHLAAALGLQNRLAAINETVVVVSSDRELLEAARDAGLKVENPALAAAR